ncbi:MAG: hypothetical protein R2941_05565 [Desulfobacterales bacterium]
MEPHAAEDFKAVQMKMNFCIQEVIKLTQVASYKEAVTLKTLLKQNVINLICFLHKNLPVEIIRIFCNWQLGLIITQVASYKGV